MFHVFAFMYQVASSSKEPCYHGLEFRVKELIYFWALTSIIIFSTSPVQVKFFGLFRA